MEINTPKELAENISKFVNVMGAGRNEQFVLHMGQEHKTLQQSFTRFCVQWLEHMASLPDGFVDARNEASRDLARKMLNNEAVTSDYGDKPHRYIPTI